jgi:hypothetical protein
MKGTISIVPFEEPTEILSAPRIFNTKLLGLLGKYQPARVDNRPTGESHPYSKVALADTRWPRQAIASALQE